MLINLSRKGVAGSLSLVKENDGISGEIGAKE